MSPILIVWADTGPAPVHPYATLSAGLELAAPAFAQIQLGPVATASVGITRLPRISLELHELPVQITRSDPEREGPRLVLEQIVGLDIAWLASFKRFEVGPEFHLSALTENPWNRPPDRFSLPTFRLVVSEHELGEDFQRLQFALEGTLVVGEREAFPFLGGYARYRLENGVFYEARFSVLESGLTIGREWGFCRW